MPTATRARAAALAVLLVAVAALWSAPVGTAGAQVSRAVAATRADVTPSIGIDPWDPNAVLDAWRSIIADSPPMGFTGDLATCNAGTTSAAYKQAELRSINALRALTGVAPLSLNSTWSAQAQQTAMLMAVNQRLDHRPTNTMDFTWKCLNEQAKLGAASSNLFLGVVGVDAMWGYIADWGDSNVDVGHRRWLVCPGSTQVGLGDVPAPRSNTWPSNAMKVFNGPATTDGLSRDGYVAWPNPGFVPLNYAQPYFMLDRFSLQVPTTVSTSGATVSITSDSRVPDQITVASTHTDDDLYCQPAIEWEPAVSPTYGETWTITVSGLTQGGETLSPYTYEVRFVDLSASTPFVQAAFWDFIGRAPSGAERTSWTRAIDATSGGETYVDARKMLVSRLSGSQEWVTHLLTTFYEDTLGRPPDPEGLAYWTDALVTGRTSVASVASFFYASQEYFDGLGGTITAWVDELYAKLLGRDADAAGRAYWVAQTIRVGRGRVAAAFYQSLESRKARVTTLYTGLLGRAPDAAGLLYWADRLASVSDLSLAASLAASDEYDQRAQVRFPS